MLADQDHSLNYNSENVSYSENDLQVTEKQETSAPTSRYQIFKEGQWKDRFGFQRAHGLSTDPGSEDWEWGDKILDKYMEIDEQERARQLEPVEEADLENELEKKGNSEFMRGEAGQLIEIGPGYTPQREESELSDEIELPRGSEMSQESLVARELDLSEEVEPLVASEWEYSRGAEQAYEPDTLQEFEVSGNWVAYEGSEPSEELEHSPGPDFSDGCGYDEDDYEYGYEEEGEDEWSN